MNIKQKIDTLIQQLHEGYRALQVRVNEIAAAETNIDKSFLFEGVKKQLADIKIVESELSPLRDQYQAEGGSLEGHIRESVDATIKIVSDLIPQLNALEEVARADRSKLAPEIHDGVRGMQMQSAYQRNR